MKTNVAIAFLAALAAIGIHGRVFSAPRGVMLMNRISPSAITLFIANADGTGERRLSADSDFDYDASFSSDGRWIVFTSERGGQGQADVYRMYPDGTGLERLTDYAGLDDQASLSADGKQLAFVSTRTANH